MELPQSLRHAAEAELGETPERRDTSLTELKQQLAGTSKPAANSQAQAPEGVAMQTSSWTAHNVFD